MVMRVAPVDDPGDSGNGGGGGTPRGGGTLFPRKWVDVNWSFPATAPTPSGFEVVVYTGTDPTVAANYLFPPINVPATERRLKKSFFPKGAMATVNAAVRAVYA